MAILHLEGPTIAGHTCKVVLIGEGEVEFEEFFGIVSERIEGVPELRRKLIEENGQYFWEEDESFSLENHLVESSEGDQVSVEELDRLTAELFCERLERDRPLWRIEFARLKGGGRALIWRIHHALADGSTAMRFAKEVLWDPADEGGTGRPAPKKGATEPAVHTEESERQRRSNLIGLFEREFSRSHGPSPFEGELGHERAIAFASVSLSALHDSARQLADATLNDAVLSVIAGSLRHWMELEHTDIVGDLRAQVPVSLHREGDKAANRDSFFSVPLHLDQADPVERLKEIRAETWERKSDHDAENLDLITRAVGQVSGRLRHLIEQVEASPRAFAVSISNVKGPRDQVSVLGAPVENLFTIAEIGEGHALRIGVISSGDQLGFGFCADPNLVKDLDQMAEGIEVEAERLERLAAEAA